MREAEVIIEAFTGDGTASQDVVLSVRYDGGRATRITFTEVPPVKRDAIEWCRAELERLKAALESAIATDGAIRRS
jgi:hypothetical protein